MHFEGNNKTAVHNHEGAFFIAFLFSDGFCAILIVDPCHDLKNFNITTLNSARYFRLMGVFACWVRCLNWHPPACFLEETSYKKQSKTYCI